MKFTCYPSNIASNHYGAILLLNKPTERSTEEKVTIESPCPSTLEEPLSLYEADGVIDLTDDSEMTTAQLPDYIQYNTSNNLFVNTTSAWLDDLPHNIDGLKLYQIKCFPQELVQRIQNLRFFKMHSSRRKDLIETSKVRRCIRNLYCSYGDYPFKLSAEGKSTLPTFRMWMDVMVASAVEM